MKIAKKYCHPTFCQFLNAILRGFPGIDFSLPKDNLEVFYSLPQVFLEMMLSDYGKEALNIFSLLNLPPKNMMRIRPGYEKEIMEKYEKKLQVVGHFVGTVVEILDSSLLSTLTKEKSIYLQNVTFAFLMQKLSLSLYKPPQKMIDLCAAPGGKLLLLNDLYPNSLLWANDLSQKRLDLLYQNCKKYGVKVKVSSQSAEKFSGEKEFDLIVLDAPCSNTGVWNRRVEARFLFDKSHLEELVQKQIAMISHAMTFLKKGGQIWYLTCSILKEENERVIEKVCENGRLKVKEEMHLILPNQQGWDGGFGCSLEVL